MQPTLPILRGRGGPKGGEGERERERERERDRGICTEVASGGEEKACHE